MCAALAVVPFSTFVVRLAATVASAASPIAAPTVRDVLSRPEARPASSRRTPAVPATAIGVTARPMPSPMRTKGPRRSAMNVLFVAICESQTSPPHATTVPSRMSGRGPNRGTRRDVTWAPAAMRTVWGRKASPALKRRVAEDVLHVERLEIPGSEQATEEEQHHDVAAGDGT